MLTFKFSGADGVMTVAETLTSGMVGKQVKLEFTSDWDNLTKTAVFEAGDISEAVYNVGNTVAIPEAVLAIARRRLKIGIYGEDTEGNITPTIYAIGPRIEEGADPYRASGDPPMPKWKELEERIEDLENGTTGGGSGSNSGQNGDGLSAAEKTLVLSLFKSAKYDGDMSATISALETLWGGGNAGGEDGGETETQTYTITNVLTNVASNNDAASVEKNGAYSATLTADSGYAIDTVHVTMGGVDITATAYAGGVVTIAAVTGNVVIVASASVAADDNSLIYELPGVTTFDGTANTVIDTGIQLCDEDKDVTFVLTVAKEEETTAGTLVSCCAGSTGTDGYCVVSNSGYSTNKPSGAAAFAPSPKAFGESLNAGWMDTVPVGNDIKIVFTHVKGSGTATAYNTAYDSGFTVKSKTASFTFAAHTNNLILGARQWNGVNGFFAGTIKDFKVYNTVLSEDKINAYMGVE